VTAVGGQKSGPLGEGSNGYPAAMLELLSLIIGTARSAVRGRNDLILENLLLRQQLQVALRPRRRLSLQPRNRLFWVLVGRLLPGWRRNLQFVRPETVIRCHRRGWRWYWQWRSRTRLGRPRLSTEVRLLITRMAGENPLWGTERIRGEVLKLGLVVSARSIRRYRRLQPARPPRVAWRTFLHNEIAGIWAVDLLVVLTLTFKTLFVLFFIEHARRHFGPLQCHRAPHGGLGLAAAPECHAGGPAAALSDS
jgi:hypothetical protein